MFPNPDIEEYRRRFPGAPPPVGATPGLLAPDHMSAPEVGPPSVAPMSGPGMYPVTRPSEAPPVDSDAPDPGAARPPAIPPPSVMRGPNPVNVSMPSPIAPAPPPVKAQTPEMDEYKRMTERGIKPKTSILGTLAGLGVRAAAGWASTPGRPPQVNAQRLEDWSQRGPDGGSWRDWQTQVGQQKERAGLEQTEVTRGQAATKSAADLAHTQAQTAETQARTGYYGDQAANARDQRRIQEQTETGRQKQAQYALKVKGREESVISLGKGDAVPDGWQVIDHPDGGKVAVPPSMIPVPEQLVPYMPGHKTGDMVGWTEYKDAVKDYRDEMKKRNIQDNKPDKPEQAKAVFQATIARVSAENNLPAGALTDVAKLSQVIKASRTITPDEKNNALAYLAANTTPAATGTNTTVRIEGMANSRELAVIDTKRGNALQYISAAEINKANQLEPGRYAPAAPGMKALTQTSLIEDIRGSIAQTRVSLAGIPEFTAADKVLIANALRDRDPKSAIGQLIGGSAGNNLTPAQQEYLIDLAQLHEQAMAMRSVLGTGTGSEDLRAAILRTIPGPGTPNKAYAAMQLNKFEQTLNRLSRGVASVPLKDGAGPAPSPSPTGATYVRYAEGAGGHQIGQKADGGWYDVTTGAKVQ